MRTLTLWLTFLALGLTSCTREPVKRREDAMRAVWSAPNLSDDLPLDTLVEGMRREAANLRLKPAGAQLTFGPTTIPATAYAAALERVISKAENSLDKGLLMKEIERSFDFYLPYGTTNWGKVLMTSYYEPEIKGSLIRTEQFTEPLLATPDDLVELAFSRVDERFADMGQLRGRLLKEKTARGTPQLVPYYSREEIAKGALSNRKLEICWVDPVDAFFLQIQGSGIVTLPDGNVVRLGYADQNGHPYSAIGKYLKDVMPLDKITQQSIESHLRTLPKEKRGQLLSRNPSYVFFQKRDGPAMTAAGTPATPGRTIATDARYFPKGALAFLTFEKPKFPSKEATEPEEWVTTSRFVFDQDVGGAIRGGGRLDLFWGTGDEAKQHAGVMKQVGTLYYLVPKKEFVTEANTRVPSPESPSDSSSRPPSAVHTPLDKGPK